MEAQNYNVIFDPFCERYYIKSFAKKYKSAWAKTRQDLEEVCRRIDGMLQYQRADLISDVGQYKLVKLDFAIAGAKQSPKASGNRCILVVNEEARSVTLIIVYSKNDIAPPNETRKWKELVKDNFVDYSQIFSL
jgi:hypothetical protein